MDKVIRVGAVNYLNAKPLLYGFELKPMEGIDMVFDFPARVASMLLADEIDLGLVPVAVIPFLKEHHIISHFCIGASGPVASVCLFSDVPLAEIEEILLDYQSRTSAVLLKILLKEHWRCNPKLVDTGEGFEQEINGTTAGMIIGDRALQQRLKSKYVYDLAEGWQDMTGLPFLFAAWVSNKLLPLPFIKSFNEATGLGIQHIKEIVEKNPFASYNLQTYFTQNIDYHLNKEKKEAMDLFLSFLQTGKY